MSISIADQPGGIPGAVAHGLPVPVVDAGLHVVRVVAVVAVPQQQPQRAQQVGLRQLHHDGARAQLVARVALLPVVVLRVAVQQGVARAATDREGNLVLTHTSGTHTHTHIGLRHRLNLLWSLTDRCCRKILIL